MAPVEGAGQAAPRPAPTQEEREALFASMLDPLVVLAAVRDQRGRIVDFEYRDANPAACAYNRLTREELVGMRLLTLLPAHAATHLIEQYASVVETGEPLVLDDYAYPREIFEDAERYYDIRAVKLGDGLSYTWRDVTDRHRIAAALEATRARLAAALASELDPHLFLDAVRDAAGIITDFRISDANPAARAYFGEGPAVLVGERLQSIVAPEEFPHLLTDYAAVVDSGEPLILDGYVALSRAAGTTGFFDVRGVRVGDGLSVTWRDVTDRVLAGERIAQSEERYRLLADNASDVVAHVRDGVIVWMSPSVESLTGLPAEHWIGQSATASILSEDLAGFDAAISQTREGGLPQTARMRFELPDGTVHWGEIHSAAFHDARGEPDGVIASLRVVDDVVQAEQKLAHAAQHDSLTGLLNRGEVFQRIGELARHRPRTGRRIGVLYCDLDDFKGINDRFGHGAGDRILHVLGERITAEVRSDDLAARTGGDELLVVLVGLHDLDEALAIADKIRAATSRPIPIGDGDEVVVTMSIGVTLVEAGEGVDDMVARADRAMYRAKAAGRDQVIAIV